MFTYFDLANTNVRQILFNMRPHKIILAFDVVLSHITTYLELQFMGINSRHLELQLIGIHS